MRFPLLAALAAALLLAGCTAQVDSARQQLDTVKESLDEAKAALDAARQEAREAKDRYERVRSLTIVREESVRLVLQPELSKTSMGFVVLNATRSDGTEIPSANLTKLPLLGVDSPERPFTCDPLTCRFFVAEGDSVVVAFLDAPDEKVTLTSGAPLPRLVLEGARVLATTSAGDATS